MRDIAVGQVWRRTDGLLYRVVGGGAVSGWSVDVGDEHDVTAGAGADPWLYTNRQFRRVVRDEGLRLAVASVAAIAQRLRSAGLATLAGRLETLALKQPARKRRRLNKAKNDANALEELMQDSENPKAFDLIRNELRDTLEVLVKDGPKTDPANYTSPPEFVQRDRLRVPNIVRK